MGKIIGAILIVLALAAAVGGWYGYSTYIKPFTDFAQNTEEFVEEMGAIEQELQHKGSYTTQPGAELTSDQLQRFLVVQDNLHTQLRPRLAELESRYKEQKQEREANGSEAGLREAAENFEGSKELLLMVRRAQVNELNEQNFSVEEYNWVRDRVYLAITEGMVGQSDLQNERDRSPEVSEEEIAMVAPHREQLMETQSLMWFGF